MLLATLPSIYRVELLTKIISHPLVSGVRYNTGARSPYSCRETLERLLALTSHYNKKLWIDLKGRQLRIVKWAVPEYGRILLNHEVEAELPARVHFRGSGWTNLAAVRGNEIFVDPPPQEAVGEGQAVNIVGKQVRVIGYSTHEDIDYIEAACKLGIFSFMLSFVESHDDISDVNGEILAMAPDREPELCLKIESALGVDFIEISDLSSKARLIAATDDLSIEMEGFKFRTIRALELIVQKDPRAIFASNIFTSLKYGESVSLADILSLRCAWLMGYRNFMLSDGISHNHFGEAMGLWENFLELYPEARD